MAALHVFLPVFRYWTFPAAFIGVVPLALGIYLNVAADGQFKRANTTVTPGEKSAALVTSFPFSMTRNPMYVGITGMLLGVALLLGTVSSLVPVVVFPVLMDRLFVRGEESMLAEAFGDEWQRYRASVRRWI